MTRAFSPSLASEFLSRESKRRHYQSSYESFTLQLECLACRDCYDLSFHAKKNHQNKNKKNKNKKNPPCSLAFTKRKPGVSSRAPQDGNLTFPHTSESKEVTLLTTRWDAPFTQKCHGAVYGGTVSLQMAT